MADDRNLLTGRVARRTLLKAAGAGALSLASAACDVGAVKSLSTNTSGNIVVGFVSPLTGPAGGFGLGDRFVIDGVRQSSAYRNGIRSGGRTYGVDVVVRDSQSDPRRASQVARDLIVNERADIVLTSSTPEVTNPVADVCETSGVPCVATVVPWEAWYFGRASIPGPQGFDFTTMFFFGVGEFAGTFLPMWNRMATNRVFATMFPNDADGNAFRGNYSPYAVRGGYTAAAGGSYNDGLGDYTGIISRFKNSNAQLFVNCPLPPDFVTFWKQAAQQGWKPVLATVAKVLLFPADTTPLGTLVNNVATNCWWSPYHPYESSLTGQSARDLADGFQQATGMQWLSTLGSTHSLFEIARNAFTAVDDPHDRAAVAAALKTMTYTGISGPLDFSNGPVPGVAIVNPVGVQWKPGKGFPWSMYVVDNSLNKAVPLNGDLLPTNA